MRTSLTSLTGRQTGVTVWRCVLGCAGQAWHGESLALLLKPPLRHMSHPVPGDRSPLALLKTQHSVLIYTHEGMGLVQQDTSHGSCVMDQFETLEPMSLTMPLPCRALCCVTPSLGGQALAWAPTS